MNDKKQNLEVLYEDNHILAVYKPAGLLMQGDKSGRPTLWEMAKAYLKDKYNKPGQVYLGLVHRLDRVVAGVVIFARTSKAAGRLSQQFREHKIKKVYWAEVEGIPPGKGTLNQVLWRDREKGLSLIFDHLVPGGQKVELSYRVIKKNKGDSLLEIRPGTGRHHQIRLQLASLGYPIIGDTLYGAKTRLTDGHIRLFSQAISFIHPITQREITIKASPSLAMINKKLALQ